MPGIDSAMANETGASYVADTQLLHVEADLKAPRGPYHILNANIVLVNSEVRRYRTRGGDSFILSPWYCGGTSVGWRRTDQFMGNGITLATAMAISGAAANPDTGVGGVGPTRNHFVSIMMALMNVRLGYWILNPRLPNRRWVRPNHFRPGFFEFVGGRYSEDSRFLQLSDGGHFENLGVYELVRRKLGLIIACDSGADADYTFSEFENLSRRIKEDFGARIEFDSNNHVQHLIPRHTGGYPKDVLIADRGYIVGKIIYEDESTGTFIFVKATLIDNLNLELLAYKGRNPLFPHQSTADQFFDERQFESYRELGHAIASQMIDGADLRNRLQELAPNP